VNLQVFTLQFILNLKLIQFKKSFILLPSSSPRAVLTCCPGQRLLVQQMLSAACAAAFSSTIMNPLDIARTRIQVSGMQAAATAVLSERFFRLRAQAKYMKELFCPLALRLR
jgi:hypothetical protein